MPPILLTVYNNVLAAKRRYLAIKATGKPFLMEKAIYDAMYQIIKDLGKEDEFKSYEDMIEEAKRK